MTIFLILVVIAGVLFIANVNPKASADRSNNLFYGTHDGGGGGDCGDGGSTC